jgi:hypothetical protein
MRFSAVAVASALVANAYAMGYGYSNATVTTEVVTEYTTYCPYATTFTEGSSTYTVTEATTLTITNCPCTRTYTLSTVSVTSCPGGCAPSSTYVAPPPVYTPVTTKSYVAPTPVYTTPVYSTPAPSQNVTTPAPPVATGAAGRVTMTSGALAAVLVVAAYIL